MSACKKSIQLLVLCGLLVSNMYGRALKDSPIQRIIVPYHTNVIAGRPYQYPAINKSVMRQVFLPKQLELIPRFKLETAALTMGSRKGATVNFVDGAYPVYYMLGNANGKFNGKISLLNMLLT